MDFKFKKYWRKTGLNSDWGNKLIKLVNEKKPSHFLEIGVFCGVTSRNICEFLNLIHRGNFTYTGIDLFGDDNGDNNEKKPTYIKHQKFSNPLKHLYYNLIMKENLNSLSSVRKFLKDLGNPYNSLLKDVEGKQSVIFGIYGIPESLIINNKNKIIKKFVGPLSLDDYKEIKEMIK